MYVGMQAKLVQTILFNAFLMLTYEKMRALIKVLVKGLQDAGVVFVTAVTLQQSIGFFTAISAKVFVQQIDHGPQVATFFHVNLKQVAQVVHARRCEAQMTLLLNRSWLGIALRHDDAAQVRSVFARHVLPNFFTFVIAKMNLTVLISRIQKHTPTIVTHFDVTKLRPTLGVNTDCCTQVHVHVF